MAGIKTAKLAADDKVVTIVPILPGTPEMERLLASGYPDIGTIENAKRIVKERAENPSLYPFEFARRAAAMIEAFTAEPAVISTKPGLVRDQNE